MCVMRRPQPSESSSWCTASHVEAIRNLCAAGGGQIDPDTFVGEASYRAALHAAGGACELVRALMRGDARAGFSAMRPSGHHAGRDYAMGFCLFNNVAIAAELAIRELGLERVLIIDWDVHHGNGTADIFRLAPRRAVRKHPRTRAVSGDRRGQRRRLRRGPRVPLTYPCPTGPTIRRGCPHSSTWSSRRPSSSPHNWC